jgi:hypothetical protein
MREIWWTYDTRRLFFFRSFSSIHTIFFFSSERFSIGFIFSFVLVCFVCLFWSGSIYNPQQFYFWPYWTEAYLFFMIFIVKNVFKMWVLGRFWGLFRCFFNWISYEKMRKWYCFGCFLNVRSWIVLVGCWGTNRRNAIAAVCIFFLSFFIYECCVFF